MTRPDDYEAQIARIVDQAPPLSQAQRDRLAALFDDGPPGDG